MKQNYFLYKYYKKPVFQWILFILFLNSWLFSKSTEAEESQNKALEIKIAEASVDKAVKTNKQKTKTKRKAKEYIFHPYVYNEKKKPQKKSKKKLDSNHVINNNINIENPRSNKRILKNTSKGKKKNPQHISQSSHIDKDKVISNILSTFSYDFILPQTSTDSSYENGNFCKVQVENQNKEKEEETEPVPEIITSDTSLLSDPSKQISPRNNRFYIYPKVIMGKLHEYLDRHISSFNSLENCKGPLDILDSFEFIKLYLFVINLINHHAYKNERYNILKKIRRKKECKDSLFPNENILTQGILKSSNGFTKLIIGGINDPFKGIHSVLKKVFFCEDYNKYSEYTEFVNNFAVAEKKFKYFLILFCKLYDIVLDLKKVPLKISHERYEETKNTLQMDFDNLEGQINKTFNLFTDFLKKMCIDENQIIHILNSSYLTLLKDRLAVITDEDTNVESVINSLNQLSAVLDKMQIAVQLLHLSKTTTNSKSSDTKRKYLLLHLMMLYPYYKIFLSITSVIKEKFNLITRILDFSLSTNLAFMKHSDLVALNLQCASITELNYLWRSFSLVISKNKSYLRHIHNIYNIFEDVNKKSQRMDNLNSTRNSYEISTHENINAEISNLFKEVFDKYQILFKIDKEEFKLFEYTYI